MSNGQQPVSLAKAYRKRRQEGTLWNAPSGATVRIRKLSLTDHAVVTQLPDNLQRVVYAMIDKSTKLKAVNGPDDPDIDDVFGGVDGKAKLDMMREMSIRLAKLGWLEPRIVDTVKDEDIEITVDEAEEGDLVAYMSLIFGDQQVEAEALAPFPERSHGSVGSGPAVSAVQPGPERAARAHEEILRRDSV